MEGGVEVEVGVGTGSGTTGRADVALLATGFLVAGAISIGLSRLGDGIAGVWFANAFAFAVLARRSRPFGVADCVALLAGSLAVDGLFGTEGPMLFLLPLFNAGQVLLSLLLVRRFVGQTPLNVAGAREFVMVLALAGGAATIAAALVFAPLASLLGGWPPLRMGWTLLSGNALGYAILLPPLLFVSRRALSALADVRAALRLAAICVCCAAVGCLSLAWGQFPFALAMLPLMVVAPRMAVFELALTCAFTGAALMGGAMGGLVPGLGHGLGAFRGGFQVAVAITVATPFMVGLFVHQITEGRRRIADAETRWNFALASAGQGVWDLDLRRDSIAYSATWAKMLGYEQHELDGDPSRWLTMVHPDDRAAVEASDRAHLEGVTPHFEAEFRMRRKDGQWIWILDRGKVVERDEQGRMVRAIGSLTDITQRKEAEQRLIVSAAMLAAEKERLRVTLHSIGDAVICTDAAGCISFMNPVAETLTDCVWQEALGRPLDEVYHAVDEESGQRLGPSRPNAGGPCRADQNSRAVLVRRDGSRCSIRQIVSPIMNEEGAFGGSVIVFQDFTDARTLQRQLAYAASHDALTGLANRSSFMRAMEEVVAEVKAGAAPRQFMFIDLDRFKLVNDTGGHAAGDALLKRVGAAIRGALGPDDLVARLGGDEFAVVLKSGSQQEAEAAAAGVVEAVRSLGFIWNGVGYTVGASIGLTPIGQGCGEADEIIARADVACYAAKAAGRGCAFTAMPHQHGAAQASAVAAPMAAANS